VANEQTNPSPDTSAPPETVVMPPEAVVKSTETATLADGTEQFRRRWSVADARAALLIAHGMGEHSGPYDEIGDFFAQRGFDVAAYDHRGYGRSGGRRGYIERWGVFVDDLADRLEERRSLGLPVVLYGHSLGGLMSLTHLVENRTQPDLAVLSAPAMLAAVPAWQKVAAPIGSVLAPTVFKPAPFEHEILTRDVAVQESYAADDLRVSGATLRLGNEIFRAIDAANANYRRIGVPTYVLHGENDRLMPSSATQPLADLPNVTYRLWEGLRHEPHREPEWPEVVGEIVAWLDGHLAQ
jgi:alpha-beta hydrolase superfamily lysophospholipase